MKKYASLKGHLTGIHECEARQVFLALRDRPDQRRIALVEAMKSKTVTPCGNHNFLNDQHMKG